MDSDPGSLPHDLWPRSVPPNRWFWISHCIQLYNKIKTWHLFSPMRTAHLNPKTLATLLPGYATYQLSLRACETWTALCYNAQYTCFCMSILLRTVGISAQWVPLKARWADLRIQTLIQLLSPLKVTSINHWNKSCFPRDWGRGHVALIIFEQLTGLLVCITIRTFSSGPRSNVIL